MGRENKRERERKRERDIYIYKVGRGGRTERDALTHKFNRFI